MKAPVRKIAFLVDKGELELLEEANLYGADIDDILEKAIKEKGKYRLEFSQEELDDLAGYTAHCANHEKFKRKQARWEALCDRVEGLLALAENISMPWESQPFASQSATFKCYIFDVWIEPGHTGDSKAKILRKIQIAGPKSLYNFAKVITQAFGFSFDHCFGFYDNFQRYSRSKKAYELFVDIGEGPLSPGTKGVKKTKISQVFKKPGERMLFFFDYGDCWRFIVELKEIRKAGKKDLKPVILESIGHAPPQYPPCEDI